MVAALATIAAIHAAGPAAAQEREIMRISFPSDDGSLTPYTFKTGYPIVMLVYDSLMWRDAQGVPRPWLASSVRREAGGRRVTVKLRRGVRWHDGRPFSADDVVFTYRHVATRRHPRFTPQVRDIASVTAPDARTVVFELRRASLGFEDQPLADVPIVPRHLWEGLSPQQLAPRGLPVGTGPFRLVSHVKGKTYAFRANRRYFKGTPVAAALEVPIIRREDHSFDLLKRATLDAAPINVPAGVIAERSRRIEFAEGVSYSGTMLAFNVARRPFHRLVARRAVAQSLDLGVIAGDANGPGAQMVADRGMLHPDSRWAPKLSLDIHDAAAARLAFAEQGIGPFTILASTGDGVRQEAARRIVRALRRMGALVRLQSVSPASFERRLGRGGRSAGRFDAAVVGIPTLASYDPAYLRNVFGDPRTAELNDGLYRSARFERLADRVASAPTTAARRRAVAAELELLAEDVPALPLFYGGTTFASRKLGYAGWVDVKGIGIYDKQSFLPGSKPAEKPPAAIADPRDPVESSAVSLVPIIVGLGVVFLLAGGWVLWRKRDANSPRRQRGR